jgi:hypothetical protein
MAQRDPLRKHILDLLSSPHAHADFDAAVRGFPTSRTGEKPAGVDHSAWELLEHMRIAQWDILEFSRNPRHVSPEWPAGYWPPTPAPPTGGWRASVQSFRKDLKAMMKLVADPTIDLFAPIPHGDGDGQTVLREALLVADHNAYHIGQLVVLRKLLGAWGT